MSFNGVVYFPDRQWTTTDTLQLFTDSAGSVGLGCGCYFHGEWVYLQGPEAWMNTQFSGYHFPGTSANCFSLLHMGKDAEWEKIILFLDNVSLVHILNKQSSRSDRVMSFLRPLVLSALQNNIQFKAKHVSGIDNKIADAISRKQ